MENLQVKFHNHKIPVYPLTIVTCYNDKLEHELWECFVKIPELQNDKCFINYGLWINNDISYYPYDNPHKQIEFVKEYLDDTKPNYIYNPICDIYFTCDTAFFNQIRIQVKKGRLDYEKVGFIYLDKNANIFSQGIDANGKFEIWWKGWHDWYGKQLDQLIL